MDDLHYSESHEWVRVDGDIGTVGITEHAQKQLGEIVYLELPEVGHVYNVNDEFGTVESVKAVSELYSPVSGEVVEVNKSAVSEDVRRTAAEGDHRLDGPGEPGPQRRPPVTDAVVGDLRVLVHGPPDRVPDVLLDDPVGVPVGRTRGLDALLGTSAP